jgi:hypothetical protein
MDPKARGLAAAFTSPSLPAALQPTGKDRLFQVALLWQGTQLVDVARCDPTSRNAREFPLANELLPNAFLPRAQSLPNGDVALFLPTETAVQIGRGETTVTPAELFAAREADPIEVPVRGLRYVLRQEERVLITSGALQLVGRYLRPEPAQHRPLRDRVDPMALSMITIGAIVLAFVLGMFRLALSTGTELDDDPLLKVKPSFLVRSPVPPPPVVHDKVLLGHAGGGTSGRPDLPVRPGGPTHGTPANHPHALSAPVMSFFAEIDRSIATSNVLGPNGNTALDKALGGVHSDSLAEAGGPGFGPRGPGPGDGPPGISIGPFGSPVGVPDGVRHEGIFIKGHEHTPFAPPPDYRLEGGLAKDVVGRIVRRHWNEIRYCYEKELAKDPNLAGKVSMSFRIGPMGDVLSAQVSESTLGNEAAEQCMTGNIRRWAFPQPKGGGVVDVNYPFMFQTAH